MDIFRNVARFVKKGSLNLMWKSSTKTYKRNPNQNAWHIESYSTRHEHNVHKQRERDQCDMGWTKGAAQIKLSNLNSLNVHCVIESAFKHTATSEKVMLMIIMIIIIMLIIEMGDNATGCEVTTFSTIKRSLQSYDRSLLEIVFIPPCIPNT